MDTATVHLEATIGSCALNMSVSVPAGPATVDDFLPLLQILDDKIVASAEDDVQRQGKCISCQKGCGACCRLMRGILGDWWPTCLSRGKRKWLAGSLPPARSWRKPVFGRS